jgi:uncharacterized protein YndB with AHSA1/START domain
MTIDATTTTDYRTTLHIRADADAVFDAVTTTDGLGSWWTRATGSGETGGELRFFFSVPEPCVMRVDRADRPGRVEWTVTDCAFLPEWVGTRPTFTIVAGDERTTVHFRHHGLNSALGCIEMCTDGWNTHLASLVRHLEDGAGSPFGG